MTDRSLARLLRIWADDAAAFARVLAQQDPALGAEHFALAGGRVVLCGPGMYVNRPDSAPVFNSAWPHVTISLCEVVRDVDRFRTLPRS